MAIKPTAPVGSSYPLTGNVEVIPALSLAQLAML